MDPRVERHAELLVDHCTGVEAGDTVLVMAPQCAKDLEVALMERLGERGASPLRIKLGESDPAIAAYLDAVDPEPLEPPAHTMALVEETDVLISIRGASNLAELSQIDPAAMQAFAKLNEPIGETILGSDEKTWVGTQYPSAGYAQRAEMSTAAYEDFVYDAVDRDWEAQRDFQGNLVDILDPADQVRIVSGAETDISMSIAGNPSVNDFGGTNLPGGEVFTAPVVDSVEGTVSFDLPVRSSGQEIEGITLTFEDGEVVEHTAQSNEDVLTGILETDAGSGRVGELGFGMNRAIDRYTSNIGLDEKMGDTVHLALGKAYPETVGDGNERNESARHEDMLVDMSEDSFVEVDGEIIQRDGTFVFEDDFDTAS